MKNQKDPMGDRMKRYEAATKLLLPRRTYTILRLDGRAFHTITRNLDRPFDARFSRWMIKLTKDLCAEVSGSVFAYTQSDEISILMQDFASTETEPWFGGEVQKIVSVAASYAGDVFPVHGAHFDARVFTIPEPVEVANYFIWRQRDSDRNAVLAYAQYLFGAKSIQGINTGELEKMILAKGIEIPTIYRHGTIVDRDYVTHEDGTRRSFWSSFIAPPLTCEPGQFLALAIPALPTLSVDSDVAQDAEGEHEHGHAEPAESDASGEVAGGEDEQDRGDDVQQDGQHVRWVLPGDVR